MGWCEESASKSSDFAAGQRGVDSRFAGQDGVERVGERIAYVRLASFPDKTQRLGGKGRSHQQPRKLTEIEEQDPRSGKAG